MFVFEGTVLLGYGVWRIFLREAQPRGTTEGMTLFFEDMFLMDHEIITYVLDSPNTSRVLKGH